MDNSWDIHYLRKIVEANANMIRLQARVAGMQAENQQRANLGQSVAYDAASFDLAVSQEQADVNSITSLLYHS